VVEIIETGTGERVVFVHGDVYAAEPTWATQRPLADNYRLLLMNRRGFGQTMLRAPRSGRCKARPRCHERVQLVDAPRDERRHRRDEQPKHVTPTQVRQIGARCGSPSSVGA
jgi:hypothetical protein